MPAKLTVLGFLVLAPWLESCAATDMSQPRFQDYPVEALYTNPLERVDLDSHESAGFFRTRLTALEGENVNFAGRFILTYWGCGAACQYLALIDARNGAVHFPDLTSSQGLCFRPDSSLLITNPMDEATLQSYRGNPPEWLVTGYYHWDGRQMVELSQSREILQEDCGHSL